MPSHPDAVVKVVEEATTEFNGTAGEWMIRWDMGSRQGPPEFGHGVYRF
jgi:hypothetical protein